MEWEGGISVALMKGNFFPKAIWLRFLWPACRDLF